MRAAEQRWRQLAESAITEQDPEQFLQLIVEIDKMLWKKLERLMKKRTHRNKGEPGDA